MRGFNFKNFFERTGYRHVSWPSEMSRCGGGDTQIRIRTCCSGLDLLSLRPWWYSDETQQERARWVFTLIDSVGKRCN